MGGETSRNYSEFLSLVSSAYSTLRKNASAIMNFIRPMISAHITDLSVTQDPVDVMMLVVERLRLDLNSDDAERYLLQLVAESLNAILPVVMEKMHKLANYFR